MAISPIVSAALAGAAGVAAGWFYHQKQLAGKSQATDKKIEEKLAAAREKVVRLREQAQQEATEIREKTERDLDERRGQILELEKRVASREEKIMAKLEALDQREHALTKERASLAVQEEKLKALLAEEEQKIAEIAGLTQKEAEARVLQLAEDRTKEDIVRRVRKLETEGEEQLAEKARDMMAMVIQRYAGSHVAEHVTSYVDVPDESMIGRIIGKEGRNIQQLERVTGCEIVVDETPNSIMISGFSPIRRQVAKTAIEMLIKDGRIHPGRIEEVVAEAKKRINDEIQKAGEEVVFDLGILDFPPKLVYLVGRMKYRTSYGQNILHHSWEAARIAAMLAEELGADVMLAKKATLLHDIGKAIDHEVEGNHVEVGEKVMRKFGLDEKLIATADAHDNTVFRSAEAAIVEVADAISAARPGARREDAGAYIKRMEDLEKIAGTKEGVEKAYAIYAGREIRVFVSPKEVDDLKATRLAQEIAKEIEQELTYPGDVKVNVIREIRAQATAK